MIILQIEFNSNFHDLNKKLTQVEQISNLSRCCRLESVDNTTKVSGSDSLIVAPSPPLLHARLVYLNRISLCLSAHCAASLSLSIS